MAGFIFKQFTNINTVGTGGLQNIALFTVPAGRIYVIKKGHLRLIRGVAGADTLVIQRSDTAGANFRQVTDAFTTAAPAANIFINLTPPMPGAQAAGALISEVAAVTQYATLENLVCEAGTVLRLVVPASYVAGDSVDTAIDGVDYTI